MLVSQYLALGPSGCAETYATRQQAVSLGRASTATNVFLCIPDGNGGFTADDVTEALALEWWRDDVNARDMRGGFVLPDINDVPLAYRPVLAGKIVELLQAQSARKSELA